MHIFVVYVDHIKINGVKQPVDIESPEFKALYNAADIVTRSKSGGYYFYFAVDKEKAILLFDSIVLLTVKYKPSLVCKTGNYSTDGRLLVDFFCDVGHLIREKEWECKPLTDKTEWLYRILAEHFVIKRTANSGTFTGGWCSPMKSVCRWSRGTWIINSSALRLLRA